MSNIDSGALDRALCLELGIEPMYHLCKCGCLDSAHGKDGCEGQWRMCGCIGFQIARTRYPALSDTKGSVLTLAEALAEKYPESKIHFSRPTPSFWHASVSIDNGLPCERNAERLPMAFALAVAAALSIEVPR